MSKTENDTPSPVQRLASTEDLLQRLRSVQQLGYRTDIGQTCREAADEIERLVGSHDTETKELVSPTPTQEQEK